MAWLGVPQTQFEANDIDNAWLGSCLKAFQKGLGANDADDAWLVSFLKDRRLYRKTSEQMMLMMRGLPRSGNGFQTDLVANDADAWLGSLLKA